MQNKWLIFSVENLTHHPVSSKHHQGKSSLGTNFSRARKGTNNECNKLPKIKSYSQIEVEMLPRNCGDRLA